MKQRSAFWDNYKGILIILVVFAHFLFTYKTHLTNTLASDITTFIYLFHMPAFIFTTGYLSRSENVFKAKSYAKLIVIYLIFNTFLMLFTRFYLHENSFHLLVAQYSYWYLLSVIAWRLMIRPLSKIKGILPISIFISILIGYWSDVGNTLSIVRTIAFFPFFLIGYKYDFKNLKIKFQNTKNFKKFLICLLISSIIVITFLVTTKLGISTNKLLYYHYKDFEDVFIRIGLIIISLIAIFTLYIIIPDKKLKIITNAGKYCLLIYLIHRPFTLIFQKIFSYKTYDDIYVLYALILTLILVIIFSTSKINNLFNTLINKLLKNLKEKTLYQTIAVIFILLMLLLKPIESLYYEIKNDDLKMKDITKIIKN